jgi:hypothetical protein
MDKWLSATPLALLTPWVAVIHFSHYLTDTFPQGTTVIVGDATNVAAFYGQIPGSQPESDGFYTFPCNADLPDISFYFNGQAFSITDSFNLGPAYGGSLKCLGGIRQAGETTFWVLGGIFMTNFYTVFDFGEVQVRNPQVGFATLV